MWRLDAFCPARGPDRFGPRLAAERRRELRQEEGGFNADSSQLANAVRGDCFSCGGCFVSGVARALACCSRSECAGERKLAGVAAFASWAAAGVVGEVVVLRDEGGGGESNGDKSTGTASDAVGESVGSGGGEVDGARGGDGHSVGASVGSGDRDRTGGGDDHTVGVNLRVGGAVCLSETDGSSVVLPSAASPAMRRSHFLICSDVMAQKVGKGSEVVGVGPAIGLRGIGSSRDKMPRPPSRPPVYSYSSITRPPPCRSSSRTRPECFQKRGKFSVRTSYSS